MPWDEETQEFIYAERPNKTLIKRELYALQTLAKRIIALPASHFDGLPLSEGMRDALLWFCESCVTKLYEEDFTVENIETDMPKIFDKYYSDANKRSCPNCGEIMQPPTKVQID